MPSKLAEADQMTVEEFLAFTESRPDGERWELIDGVAVMSPSPTDWQQTICTNLAHLLMAHKLEAGASWLPMLGVGTRVPISPNSLPRPDVLIRESAGTGSHTIDDALVIFEALSRSNAKADRAWRKRVYSSVPNCQHYVTVATSKAEIIRHDRAGDWEPATMTGLFETLELPAARVTLALRDIYRFTPIE
jgi:Uma2 family endonuclease